MTMINPESVDEFRTFGRHFKELVVKSAGLSTKNFESIGRKHRFPSSYSFQNEVYKCRYLPDKDMVEEFFAFGNIGVLTRNDSSIERTFTADFDIMDMFWCDFSAAISDPMWQNCIVLLGSTSMDVYMDNGEMLSLALPLHVMVQRCFTASFGLIFERVPLKTKSEIQTFPTIFSLSHPLNELLPVIYRTSENKSTCHYLAKYLTADFISVVFSSDDSIILTFNRKTGLHGVWYSKKASSEEASAAALCLEESFMSMTGASLTEASSFVADMSAGLNMTSSAHVSGTATTLDVHSSSLQLISTTSTIQAPGSSHQATSGSSSDALLKLSASVQSATASFSHSSGKPKNESTVGGVSSSVLTPNESKSTILKYLSPLTPTATGARLQSPAVMKLTHNSFGKTCHKSPLLTASSSEGFPTPASYQKSQSTCSVAGRSHLTEANFYWPAEPPIPDICMALLWQEESVYKSDNRAAKAFRSTDFVGQRYLFYLIREMQQLRCLKFSYKTDGCPQVSSDPFQVFSCRDACISLASPFIAMLDLQWNVVLYSGTMKIAAVNLSSILMQSFQQSCSGRDVSHPTVKILCSSIAPSSFEHTFCEPDLGMSPVSNASLSASVSASFDYSHQVLLSPCDATGAFVSSFGFDICSGFLCLVSGSVFRVKLPSIAKSSFVSLCLSNLREVMPGADMMEFHRRFYLEHSRQTAPQSESEMLLFLRTLLSLAGYDVTEMPLFEKLNSKLISSPFVPAKKRRVSEAGDESWNYLLTHSALDAADNVELVQFGQQPEIAVDFAVSAAEPLFHCIPSIFVALHCALEEACLDCGSAQVLRPLSTVLYYIASSLKVPSRDYYQRFHPMISNLVYFIQSADTPKLVFPPNWCNDCWNVYDVIAGILGSSKFLPPFIGSACHTLWHTLTLCTVMSENAAAKAALRKVILGKGYVPQHVSETLDESKNGSDVEAVLALLRTCRKYLFSVSPGVALTVTDYVLRRCDDDERFLEMAMSFEFLVARRGNFQKILSDEEEQKIVHDGMHEALKNEFIQARFPNDQRLREVRRLLCTSEPTVVALKHFRGLNDQEFREDQERFLYSACLRLMTCPVGRGMFTLWSTKPLVARPVSISKLNLTGKTPQNLPIDLSHIDVATNIRTWPQFHNGVAAALTASSNADFDPELNSTWISYNLPKLGSLTETISPEQAGFVFGLGLTGHLKDLALFNIHEYLAKGDAMLSAALLLGISAAQRGTADVNVFKMLAAHLPFLLPPTLLELNIDPLVQTAAVIGAGLLYAESSNSRMSEALVREIGRPASVRNDSFIDREAYALSCGLALGFINLGKGSSDPQFLSDLLLLANGGRKVHSTYCADSQPSNLVKEGELLNVHVTAAPAVVALGLMFLKRGDAQVASWLKPPDSHRLLMSVRPDVLLLKTLARSLVMWHDIIPSIAWVESHVPTVVADMVKTPAQFCDREDDDVDNELIAQAYCYTVAGGCLSIGFRFAGSGNRQAFLTLRHYMKVFLVAGEKPGTPQGLFRQVVKKAGRYAGESCVSAVLLAMGMVLAGTGNLDLLRIIRYCHGRLDFDESHLCPFHMATHMTLGLLFLGGGRYSLKTDDFSIAAMLAAFYPTLPIHSNDNRYHLQPLRHLYIFACHFMALYTEDASTNRSVCSDVLIKYAACEYYDEFEMKLQTPCILPPLDILDSVVISNKRFWPVAFYKGTNWSTLKKLLKNGQAIPLRDRSSLVAGCKLFTIIEDEKKRGSSTGLSCLNGIILEALKRWTVASQYQISRPLVMELVWRNLACRPFLLNDAEQVKLLSQYLKTYQGKTKTGVRVISEELMDSLNIFLNRRLVEGIKEKTAKAPIIGSRSGEQVTNALQYFRVEELTSILNRKPFDSLSEFVDVAKEINVPFENKLLCFAAAFSSFVADSRS